MSNENYNGYVDCQKCVSQVGVWRQKCPTCGLTVGGKLFGSLIGHTQLDENLDNILDKLDSIDIKILQFLKLNKDGCSINSICKDVNIPYGKITLKLENLYNNGFVGRDQYDLSFSYFITPNGLTTINYILKN